MRDTLDNYLIFLSEFLSNKNSYELFVALIILVLIIFISDYFFRFLITQFLKRIDQNSNFEWYVILYKNRIFTSIAHFFSFALGFSVSHFLLADFKFVIAEIDKIFFISIILFFFQLIFRLIDVVGIILNKDQETYKTVAFRTFSQFFKIVIISIGLILIISLLFNVNLNSIVTSISAITAIILLIFKDTIVGFVSGIQISTTKILKIGDFITIEKFNLEGIVREINLTSTKIENFDKSVSFIPTFDLLTSKIINQQPAIDLNIKKIKRSIFFNISSIKYLSQEKFTLFDSLFSNQPNFLNELKKIDLNSTSNLDLFNLYLNFYLEKNDKIAKKEPFLVKTLPVVNYAVPIQLSFFCKSSKPIIFEKTISEVLTHAIIISREFGLELLDKEN